MLMWSHYAQYHQGFALVYDMETLLKAPAFDLNNKMIKGKTLLKPIVYDTNRFDVTEFFDEFLRINFISIKLDAGIENTFPEETLRQILLHKSKMWEYECEWRMIPRHINLEKESKLLYISAVPKAIIIGADCRNDEKIVSIAKHKGIKVLYSSIDNNSSVYRLVITDSR